MISLSGILACLTLMVQESPRPAAAGFAARFNYFDRVGDGQLLDRVIAPPEDWMKSAADYSKTQRGQTMVVVFDGQIVFERYDNGGARDKVQMLASGSKSFVGVAAAAAMQDKVIRLDDPVCESITEWKADPKKANITYRQLLTLTSGLTPGERGNAMKAPAWQEIAGKPMAENPASDSTTGPIT